MLVQDNSIFPSMSGDGLLRRSSWKAEAIRRGDLKISGPIPITEETPLSDEEERKYAEKHGVDPPASLPEPTAPPPPPPQQDVAEEEVETASIANEPVVEQAEEHEEPRQHNMLNGARDASPPQRKSSPEPAAVTSPSPFPSVENSVKTPPKKKRKSGLRSVFRKMFGRRSRERSHGEEEEDTVHRHTYHRSDPGALRQSLDRQGTSSVRPRISDLPVRELQPINPLGQHLPFPMNVNAPQETNPTRDFLAFEVPEQPGQRRATLPSLLFSRNDAEAIHAAWGGKSAMSFVERQETESIPSPQIGMAISSPTGARASSIQSKRRSRSAGALRDWAKARPSAERRRSEEIRYWRHSHQSASLYSSNTPRPRTAQTVETVRTIDEHDDATKAPNLVTHESSKDSAARHDVVVEQHDQDLSEIQLPVEAFNFGNLRSTFSDEELPQHKALEPEPEPEPAPEELARSSKRLSIEERVQHLEKHVHVLETSFHRLSGRSNRQTIILENAPKGRRSRNRSSSATSDRQGSHHSSKSSNKTLSTKPEPSGPPSPSLAPLSAVSEFPTSHDRPQTVVALEPSALPKPTSEDSSLAEQVAALSTALKHERASRKALEKQVSALQREVADLQTLFNKLVSASPSYPTPSPDGIIVSNEERLTTPRAVTGPGHGLGFRGEEDGLVPGSLRRTRETIISRFSQSDSEHGDESTNSLTSSKEDITSPEAWATPKEESGFGSGFFGYRNEDEMF